MGLPSSPRRSAVQDEREPHAPAGGRGTDPAAMESPVQHVVAVSRATHPEGDHPPPPGRIADVLAPRAGAHAAVPETGVEVGRVEHRARLRHPSGVGLRHAVRGRRAIQSTEVVVVPDAVHLGEDPLACRSRHDGRVGRQSGEESGDEDDGDDLPGSHDRGP